MTHKMGQKGAKRGYYSFNSFGHAINQMFCVLYEQTCPFTIDAPDEALFSFWFTGFQHLFRGVQIWALGWPTHSCNPIVFSPPFRQPASVLGIGVLPQRPPTAAAKAVEAGGTLTTLVVLYTFSQCRTIFLSIDNPCQTSFWDNFGPSRCRENNNKFHSFVDS